MKPRDGIDMRMACDLFAILLTRCLTVQIVHADHFDILFVSIRE